MPLNAEQIERLRYLDARCFNRGQSAPYLTPVEVIERVHLTAELWSPLEVQHAISRAWCWNPETRVPDLLWCCWNGPIGNPSDNEQVYVLPLIPGQPPPTSENLQTADFEDVANLYMTEQQCREANKPVYRGL